MELFGPRSSVPDSRSHSSCMGWGVHDSGQAHYGICEIDPDSVSWGWNQCDGSMKQSMRARSMLAALATKHSPPTPSPALRFIREDS